MGGTTEAFVPLNAPNSFQDSRAVTEERAADSASSSSSSLSSSSSSATDGASANPNGIQTPAAKTKKRRGIPAKCKALHYMYVHEGDAEGFTLVGTRVSCCASSLLGSPLRAIHVVGGQWRRGSAVQGALHGPHAAAVVLGGDCS